MEYFEVFPRIVALGAHRLQELCDEWAQTPVAKECGVDRAIIRADATGFLDVKLMGVPGTSQGELVHFPGDNFLRFVFDREFSGPERDRLHDQLTFVRRKVGSEPFQRMISTRGIPPSGTPGERPSSAN